MRPKLPKKIQILEVQLVLLRTVEEKPSTSATSTPTAGVFHFLWGKCSEVVLGEERKVTLGNDKEKSAATTKILTPASEAQFFETLNLWQAMVVQARV